MDYSPGKSPRRELQLQGPRPTPLKIHKDSHKIKKPPVAPQPSQQPNQQQQPHHYQQPRQPVIIYTVSPKVIHTNPSEFMDLVQRLTGLPPSNSSTASSSPPSNNNINPPNYDNYNNPPAHDDQGMKKASTAQDVVEEMEIMDGGGGGDGDDDGDGGVRQRGMFPGILSPGPASLTPIPSNFFSPPADSFFHDLSPVLYGNRNFIEGSFMPSPSNFFSPSTSMDLFNNFPYQ
ncbi:protein MKS1-like [Pyrus communis]|uniref:protein MKS1-like n=1 Tax=Pyrus communis TaxID=23211 RepID=UPI0035C0231F